MNDHKEWIYLMLNIYLRKKPWAIIVAVRYGKIGSLVSVHDVDCVGDERRGGDERDDPETDHDEYDGAFLDKLLGLEWPSDGKVAFACDRDERERRDRDERVLDEVLRVANELAEHPVAFVPEVHERNRQADDEYENVDNAEVNEEIVGVGLETFVVQIDDDHENVAHQTDAAHERHCQDEYFNVEFHFIFCCFYKFEQIIENGETKNKKKKKATWKRDLKRAGLGRLG